MRDLRREEGMDYVRACILVNLYRVCFAFFMESRWIGVDRSDRAFSGVIRVTLDSVFSLAT